MLPQFHPEAESFQAFLDDFYIHPVGSGTGGIDKCHLVSLTKPTGLYQSWPGLLLWRASQHSSETQPN